MVATASQITSLTIVFSTVYSDADQRKHQSSSSLAYVRGIHPELVNSPHKWPVTQKMFPFHDVIMRDNKSIDEVWKYIKGSFTLPLLIPVYLSCALCISGCKLLKLNMRSMCFVFKHLHSTCWNLIETFLHSKVDKLSRRSGLVSCQNNVIYP